MQNFLSRIYYRFKYGIRIYTDVLKEEERLYLLEESKNYLQSIPNCPGLQTRPELHLLIKSKSLLKLMNKMRVKYISKCWVNYTDEEMKYLCWHNHSTWKYTSVYYLDNPEGKGTIFKDGDKVFQIDLPTNTLMVIPGNIEHSVPPNITKPRYSLVIDSNG